jgi:hypothetical protein
VILSNFRRTRTVPFPNFSFIKNSLGTFDVPYYRTIIKNLKFKILGNFKFFVIVRWFDSTPRTLVLF